MAESGQDKPAQTCSTCRYEAPLDAQFVCKRYPPVMGMGATAGHWPIVLPSDWCGEWQQKPAEAPPAKEPAQQPKVEVQQAPAPVQQPVKPPVREEHHERVKDPPAVGAGGDRRGGVRELPVRSEGGEKRDVPKVSPHDARRGVDSRPGPTPRGDRDSPKRR